MLDCCALTFKNCNFTTVKTRFLKMCGFGAKIVLAKTWGFKGAKIKSFGNSGCELEPVLAPKELPRGGPNPPKRAQEAPESTLKSIFKSKISIYQKCVFSAVKCCFLRVGGPAWELKIDAERLQETEKNEEEEESEKRREKSAYIWPEKGPPKKCLS